MVVAVAEVVGAEVAGAEVVAVVGAEVAVVVAEAVVAEGMEVEEEIVGKAAASLSQGPWRGHEQAQSQVTASGRR